MRFEQTSIAGVWVITPKVFEDDRGYFFESYRDDRFHAEIGDVRFVQENESRSVRGVLRGVHYQLPPHAQSKLVRVVAGDVLDVAVDLRRESPTFGRHVSARLSAANRKQLFIPRGFGHGFLTLSDVAIVQYKVDAYYDSDSDRSLRFNDPALGIDWPLPSEELLLSDKDASAPLLKDAELFEPGWER